MMYTSGRALVVILFITLIAPLAAMAEEWPQYCCTTAGVLGPYPNNSVREGESCYGTKNGRRYEGTACFSRDNDSEDDEGARKPHKNKSKRGLPQYCCTRVGALGPYDNDSVKEGESCYGTKNGRRYEGKACYGDEDDEDDEDDDDDDDDDIGCR